MQSHQLGDGNWRQLEGWPKSRVTPYVYSPGRFGLSRNGFTSTIPYIIVRRCVFQRSDHYSNADQICPKVSHESAQLDLGRVRRLRGLKPSFSLCSSSFSTPEKVPIFKSYEQPSSPTAPFLFFFAP